MDQTGVLFFGTPGTGTVTPGKIPMFVGSQDGGNNYECRKQF